MRHKKWLILSNNNTLTSHTIPQLRDPFIISKTFYVLLPIFSSLINIICFPVITCEFRDLLLFSFSGYNYAESYTFLNPDANLGYPNAVLGSRLRRFISFLMFPQRLLLQKLIEYTCFLFSDDLYLSHIFRIGLLIGYATRRKNKKAYKVPGYLFMIYIRNMWMMWLDYLERRGMKIVQWGYFYKWQYNSQVFALFMHIKKRAVGTLFVVM